MADKNQVLYDASGSPAKNPVLTTNRDEAERKRAEYDASVVNSGTASAKKRGGITTSVFKLNAPDMPRRAIAAKREMNPKPPTEPY